MQGLFLEGHRSAKQGTNYIPAPTACTQATQKYDASFFLKGLGINQIWEQKSPSL